MRPFNAFPVGEYVHDELVARGMSTETAAIQLGGNMNDIAINHLWLDLLTCEATWTDTRIVFSARDAAYLERLLGIKAQTWINLDIAFRKAMEAANN